MTDETNPILELIVQMIKKYPNEELEFIYWELMHEMLKRNLDVE